KIASATAATKSPFIRARQKPAPTRPDRTSDCCLRALQVCWPSLGEADARDVGDEIAGRAGDHLFTIVNSPDRRRSATPLAFLASRDLSRAQPALSILGVRGEGRRSLAAEAPARSQRSFAPIGGLTSARLPEAQRHVRAVKVCLDAQDEAAAKVEAVARKPMHL